MDSLWVYLRMPSACGGGGGEEGGGILEASGGGAGECVWVGQEQVRELPGRMW